MADVRSMLRSEQAARRITHPQAQYTSTGALICKACRVQLKSDALWQSHISSSQHINSLKSLASGLKSQSSAKGTKRKAEDDASDGDDEVSRKRAKAKSEERDAADTKVESKPAVPAVAPEPSVVRITATEVDEDEWAAFERDVARDTATDQANAQAQVFANATISAMPMTAADIAAASKQDESTQNRERREAEMEEEKEEAQRRLEDEFDEMEELEARVKRLKDQREALRLKTRPQAMAAPETQQPSSNQVPGDDDGDSEDDDWDDWGGR